MNNLTKLEQAAKNWDCFVIDCLEQGINDPLFVENHTRKSFNTNDNDSIEYSKQANKQLFFD